MDLLKLFQYNQKLKFSDIEKALKVRSNKLAYHLKNLTKTGILIKESNHYYLSKTSEQLIPYLSEKNSPLPVLLIHIGNNKEVFLWKRNKRPFKDMLSLPGGRILLEESLSEATKRIMKKYRINARLKKINSVSLEKVREKDNILHSFFLIFVSATTKDKIKLINLGKNRKSIITSDYTLIKKDLKKKLNIKTLITKKF
jgi:ADP-ribose pyrophosphatase YjhB (NUDIX family)